MSFVFIELHKVTDRGTHITEVAFLPRELCTPKCLVTAAVTAGAVFAVCPEKYGCKQFLNPAFNANEK